MSDWQPIETAPKDGNSILACDARLCSWMQVVAWDDETVESSGGYGCSYADGSFTHWMPVPAPPVLPIASGKE